MFELMRFALVGVVNTLFGYAVFWVGLRYLGLAPGVANALSYAVSLGLAFVLTRAFVFRGAARAPAAAAAWRFALAFALAFGLNQAVLWLLLHGVGWPAEVAQIGAMVSYTVVFFALNKFFVFRSGSPAGTAG